MATAINEEVLDVLRKSQIHDDRIVLPDGQLSRDLYVKVDKVIKAYGGKWNTKQKAHLVPITSIEDIRKAIDFGEYFDVVKENGFFPTPEFVADDLIQLANIDDSHSFLEPSAGKGNIIKSILKRCPNANISFCEIHEPFQKEVAALGAKLVSSDFFEIDRSLRFDRIIANPPFSKQIDIRHVDLMLDLLAPGGCLVSIMASSVKFRETKVTKDLYNRLLKDFVYSIIDIPEKSFKESGTLVNTVILKAIRNN